MDDWPETCPYDYVTDFRLMLKDIEDQERAAGKSPDHPLKGSQNQ